MSSTETGGVCIRHSELAGASRLFVDLLYDFPRVSKFFAHDPSDPASLAAAAAQIEYPEQRRARVGAALGKWNAGSPSLELFLEPGTAAVVTGQQVGLFGGPVYTLYKALSAVALARELTAQGKPTAPIFWLATEDHDVEEVRSAEFFAGRITADANSDGRPAGLHVLSGIAKALPLSGAARALAEKHYRNGATFGEAFLGLLRELLGPLGLLFVDPLDTGLREASAEFLARAAEAAPRVSPMLAARGRELEAAGYHAQVHFEDRHTSLLFRFEGGKRQQLKFDGSRYAAEGVSWSPEELAREGAALSPNALLRPVWQDWMFPTVAVIGGPGELAYFAQSEVLYRELLGRMPVAMPRSFFTIVDSRSASLMERYRLRFPDVLRDEGHVRNAVSQRLIPPPLMTTLEETEQRVERAFRDLDQQLRQFDPTLVDASARSQAKIRYQFTKNKSKIVREVFRKNEQARRHAEHLSHRLAPHGHLQERHYSLLAMLDEYGLDFVPTILANIHSGCHDHHVLMLG
jgi:bacillithiol biosynthesis cysteine-adding enzyme BshC